MRVPPLLLLLSALPLLAASAPAQEAPYDNPPPAEPPYYRVRYEASAEPGGLVLLC